MATLNLSGKVALVTGSARRVGRTIALACAAQGLHIAIHYGNPSSADDAQVTADLAQQLGVRAEIIPADLRDPAQIAQLFAQVRAVFGRLDVLVNNASVFAKGTVSDTTLEAWQQALDVNVTAPFLCSQHAATLMREQAEGGSIINILDLSAFNGWATYAPHSVSKAALHMLTKVLALGLAPSIRVNAVAPGPVLRDEGNSEERWAQIGARLPLRTTGDPEDVAQAVIFLAQQPFITGITVRVDGGESL
jgi:pteridine reductase